MKVVMFVAL